MFRYSRWTVMYQLVTISLGLAFSLTDVKILKYKARISILYAVALVWVAVNLSRVVPYSATIGHMLTDAEISESDFKDTVSASLYLITLTPDFKCRPLAWLIIFDCYTFA